MSSAINHKKRSHRSHYVTRSALGNIQNGTNYFGDDVFKINAISRLFGLMFGYWR